MSLLPFDDIWRPRRRFMDPSWDMMTSRDWMTTRDPFLSHEMMTPYMGRRGLTSFQSRSEHISDMEKKFDELVRKVDERFSGILSVLDDPEPFARHRLPVELEGKSAPEVSKAKDFSLKIDVQDFKPEEVKVKVQGGQVLVHAKRENKNETDGMYAYSYREFKRGFSLPPGVDQEKLTSSLSSAGVLQIDAPVAAAIESPKGVPVSVEHGV